MARRSAPAASRQQHSPPPQPTMEHHHRDIRGGGARAAIFGVSDGLVSNVLLILGMAGGTRDGHVVLLAGLVALVSGAVSMAAGEYVSMRAQAELLERELEIERKEIRRRPENERRELAQIYRSRGVDPATADDLATEMMRDPELALETHAREELGIDPNELGSPRQAAVSSFVTFAIGAFVPVAPWLFGSGAAATVASVGLGACAAVAVGVLLARFTGRAKLVSAMRQLAFTMIPAAATYGIGRAVGVAVS